MNAEFFSPRQEADRQKLLELVATETWADGETPKVLSHPAAERLAHWNLFLNLVTRHDTWTSYDSIPLLKGDVENLAIPFPYDRHCDEEFGDGTVESLITDFLNQEIQGKKYLLSCDPTIFLAIEIEKFGYDHIDLAINMRGENSHFVLFSEEKKLWATFYGRFPFATVSRRVPLHRLQRADEVEKFLRDGFSSNFRRAFADNSSDFTDFFLATYAPRLGNFRVVS